MAAFRIIFSILLNASVSSPQNGGPILADCRAGPVAGTGCWYWFLVGGRAVASTSN